jgi:hypothetical protein
MGLPAQRSRAINRHILIGFVLAGVLTSNVWSNADYVVGDTAYTTPNREKLQAALNKLDQNGVTPGALAEFAVGTHQATVIQNSRNGLILAAPAVVPSQNSRMVPPSRKIPPAPIKPRPIRVRTIADQLLDTRQLSQEKLDQSTCSRVSASSLLDGANTGNDKNVLSQVVDKMDGWFPGWSDELLKHHITIVITDHAPNSGQACVIGNGDGSLILIDRRVMNASTLNHVVWLAQGLAHEANHIFNASWTMPPCTGRWSTQECLTARRTDEVLCLMKNAETMRAALADPDYATQADHLRSGANQQAFYAEQYSRTNIALGETFNMEKDGWVFSAYWQAIRYLVKDGVAGDYKATLLSSRREASSAEASPDAKYTFNFKTLDGRQLTYQFHLDETGPYIGPPGAP